MPGVRPPPGCLAGPDKARPDDKNLDMQTKRRILIVDDHEIVRLGLVGLLNGQPDLEVSAQAASADEAMTLLEAGTFDLAILDIGIGSASGLTLCARVRERWPDLPLLMLSMFSETAYAERALRAGAQGYVMKSEAAGALVAAVRKVLDGGMFFSDRVMRTLFSRVSSKPAGKDAVALRSLSDRELEVLRLIGEGMSTAEIAAALNRSVKTVESHRASLKTKLGAQTNAELIRIAVAWHQGPDRA